MPKIRLLDKEVSELIAAGEVVERPSSVIKELVENSVDAGATVITVEIRNGGITYMRVTDNGCGIDADDVPTAFLRHATSKIQQKDDLYSIGTLGFRGEALASVSAVAKVELLTKTHDSETGVHYVSDGNDTPLIEEAGCPGGTTIVVRDLFYNTPARMKFLKKDSVEGNAVAGILDKISLSHPDISIRFIRDGKEQLHTPGDGKLSSAIYSVFGKEFASDLIPVDYELNHIAVSGYISAPYNARPNRTMQNFFINGRYIRSRTAAAALEEAYKGSVMTGKFPSCVINLKLSFEAVDVNVHPAKMEVRFVNERLIFDAVYHAVKSALNAKDKPKVMELPKKPIPQFAAQEAESQVKFADSSLLVKKTAPGDKTADRSEYVTKDFSETKSGSMAFSDSGSKHFAGKDEKEKTETERFFSGLLNGPPTPPENKLKEISEPSAAVPVIPVASDANISEKEDKAEERFVQEAPREKAVKNKVIGEAFGTYIILERDDDSLMLIDKHAAHERLLYEKLRGEALESSAQTLIEAVRVSLDKIEYSAVMEHVSELSKVGFEIEDFGVGTVLIRAVPVILDGEDAAAAFTEIASYIASYKMDFTTEHLDWVFHNVACRAAMKAGDTTSLEEILSLVKMLEDNPDIRYCPHGRPISIIIKRKTLEKQFGRA